VKNPLAVHLSSQARLKRALCWQGFRCTSSWQRDLTREGIEPNPGPNPDHLSEINAAKKELAEAKDKVKDKEQLVEEAVAKVKKAEQQVLATAKIQRDEAKVALAKAGVERNEAKVVLAKAEVEREKTEVALAEAKGDVEGLEDARRGLATARGVYERLVEGASALFRLPPPLSPSRVPCGPCAHPCVLAVRVHMLRTLSSSFSFSLPGGRAYACGARASQPRACVGYPPRPCPRACPRASARVRVRAHTPSPPPACVDYLRLQVAPCRVVCLRKHLPCPQSLARVSLAVLLSEMTVLAPVQRNRQRAGRQTELRKAAARLGKAMLRQVSA
jgi:hypothetical protein